MIVFCASLSIDHFEACEQSSLAGFHHDMEHAAIKENYLHSGSGIEPMIAQWYKVCWYAAGLPRSVPHDSQCGSDALRLWPLGGLAFCSSGGGAKGDLLVALAGKVTACHNSQPVKGKSFQGVLGISKPLKDLKGLQSQTLHSTVFEALLHMPLNTWCGWDSSSWLQRSQFNRHRYSWTQLLAEVADFFSVAV